MTRRHASIASTVTIAVFAALTKPPTACATSVPSPPHNLCIEDSSGCKPTVTGPSRGVSWHPGHYVTYLTIGGTAATPLITQLQPLGSDVKGIAYRIAWGQLEPSRGVYDFSRIQTVLNQLQGTGLRMILTIEDRGTFDGVVPAYLATEPGGSPGIVVGSPWRMATLYRGPIMDRFIALHQALSAWVDTQPLIEGIRMEAETDIGLARADWATYNFDEASYITQLLKLATAAGSLYPHKLKWIAANYLPSQTDLQTLIATMASQCVGVMGSDLRPGKLTWAERIMMGQRWVGGAWATGYHSYIGEVALDNQIQDPEMGGKEGNWTPAQFYTEMLARSQGHVVWQPKDYAWKNYGILANQQTYWSATNLNPDTSYIIRSYLGSGDRSLGSTPPTCLNGNVDTN